MTKKSRYLLLGTGFIAFLILAPLTVLYVRGISYDFGKKSFVQTGILALSINPSNAAVFLDGKQKLSGQGNIKFLSSGEYQVEVKKTGYQPWEKRLVINAGQVTWASPSFNSIYLFLQNPPAKTLASGVLDFYSQNSNLIWLDAQNINLAPANNPGTPKSYALPKAVDKILAVDSSGKNFVLGNSSPTSPAILVFNSDTGKFFDISSLLPENSKMQFAGDGILYALSVNVLYNVNLQQKTKTPVFTGVQAFYFLGDSLYFIQNNILLTSQGPFLSSQPLLTSLPKLTSASLFVTYGKQIFLLSGGDLYLANSSMQLLATNVDAGVFGSGQPSLPVLHNGELDYYNPSAQALQFVTRSSQNLQDPVIRSDIASAFFVQNNRLEAIELDSRDQQNQYQLYSGKNLQEYFIDSSAKNAFLLDNGNLESLEIR